jgi:hypothetical protein
MLCRNYFALNLLIALRSMTCIMLMAMLSSLAIKSSSDEVRGQNDSLGFFLGHTFASDGGTQNLFFKSKDS